MATDSPVAVLATTSANDVSEVSVVALKGLPGTLYWIVTFITITIPTMLFTIFSTTLTFSLNATTLLLIVLAFASTISWVVRYRFLNVYARLPPEPQRKEPQIDLFPDTQEGEHSKPGLANYLDEFLSAIKVFGYLERPVFHELTRTMQTRKLIAGETLMLEEEKGFCLVVDGLVQIFVKSDHENRTYDRASWLQEDGLGDEEEEQREDHQGYQLLTEVKNGAPMSSLFSILSLFTEDIKLRHDDVGIDSAMVSGNASANLPPARSPPTNGIADADALRLHRLSHVPPISLDSSNVSLNDAQSSSAQGPNLPRVSKQRRKSAHPNIVARATIDTTIAIIPASAFRRLTRVYPKATAHIVQVILSRLQRVTLSTAHAYLGLTSEVLMIEKHMSKFTTYDLPNHLRGAALERLKDKFQREKDRLESAEDGMKGIALHNPNAGRRRRSSNGVRMEMLAHTRRTTSRSSNAAPFSSTIAFTNQQSSVSPGDLLANIQVSRFGTRHPTLSTERAFGNTSSPVEAAEVQSPLTQGEVPPFDQSPLLRLHRQESLDEDDLFRDSILTCMTKSIGLTNVRNAFNKINSVEQSPRLISYDHGRQMATFSNAFGFIDPYDGSGDGDTESLASASAYSANGPSFISQAFNDDTKNEIEIVFFPKGAVLVEQGERSPGLYYVIDGFLDVSFPVEDKITTQSMQGLAGTLPENFPAPLLGAETASIPTGRSPSISGNAHKNKKGRSTQKSLFMIKPGGLAGYVGTVSSYRSFVDVRAKTDVYVGFLPRASLERVVEKYPVALLTMAKRLTSLLPRLILHIDFALEWVQINAGDVMYHQNDDSDAIYIVLNGRLRAILERGDGDMRVVGEYGQGESVGELEVMTESVRPATLHAIRDTEVAKFPRSLFNSLAQEHPGITMKVSKIIAQRMRSLVEDPLFELGQDKKTAALAKPVTSSVNLRTITILPITAGAPVIEFGTRLLTALSQIGVANGATSLNQAAILNHLGRHAFSKMGKLKLSQYLADLEERYGMLVYIADTNVNSPWTQTCIRQADCILLLGLAESSPAVGEFERFLLGMKTTARKELVLLHTEKYSQPGLTRKWLSNRLWVNGGHHHIHMAYRNQTVPVHHHPARRFGTTLKHRVQTLQAEIQKYTSKRIRQTPLYSSETPFKGDFHRLARRLCGKSVGLVLGGGGARGISHVGIIRALEEAGIPIDIVGGTSIGSFVGALYARDADVVPMYGRVKKFSGRMGSAWRFALDLTYPSVSYTTGHEFNRGIFKTFGDSQIEDCWLEFYCNTTNISKSRSEIHNSGYVWRYVRASMSLAGLLPPLCDEGNMLLDGGYVDNLTVAHMKSLGADVIFAIDVGALDDHTPQSFGDSLSGFWALVNRFNPFSSLPNPPTLSEIQARLAYVSSVDALERAKSTPGCLYMRPPIDPYGTLDFAKFDEIYEVGYKYGTEFLANLRDKGVLPAMEETEEKKKLRRTMAPRRASI